MTNPGLGFAKALDIWTYVAEAPSHILRGDDPVIANRIVAGVAALAAAAAVAEAQTSQQLAAGGISPAFAQYLNSKSNRDVINQVIRAQASRYPDACTDIVIESKFKVLTIAAVQFDGRRFTPGGAWKETVQATSCGKSRVHNVHTFVRPDGNLQRSPMLPGSTIADLLLQRDTVGLVYVNVAANAKDCPRTQHFIEDTKFLHWDPKPIPNAKAGPNARAWDEEWTASACGKPMVLSVRFTPDATGTGFAVQLKK
ncbi:MAG TPA: hypothetical protein VH913_19700 [Hyphomicrobiaceae bacterium]|jgi:hypothetical protein